MRLLLDTHIALWEMQGEWRPSAAVATVLENATELRLSVVSFIEVGIKMSIGKLRLARDMRDYAGELGMQILGLTPEHGLGVAELPLHHRDPLDRLVISQARHERLTVLTADRRFTKYDVPVVLA
jgi:PIN domain nuclease of toxin-antitoxin system